MFFISFLVCNTGLSPAQQVPLFAWKAILISSITVFWHTVQCAYNAWYWLQCVVYTSPFYAHACPRYILPPPPENVRRMWREGWIKLWRKQTAHSWRHVISLGGASCYKYKKLWSEEDMQDTAMLVVSCSNNATKRGRLIWKHCFVCIVNPCVGYFCSPIPDNVL